MKKSSHNRIHVSLVVLLVFLMMGTVGVSAKQRNDRRSSDGPTTTSTNASSNASTVTKLSLCISPFQYRIKEGRAAPKSGSNQEVFNNPKIISEDIRVIESLFWAAELENMIEKTGRFASVSVLPDPTRSADLCLVGMIKESDGNSAEFYAELIDSNGKRRARKAFSYTTGEESYKRDANGVYDKDPYYPLLKEVRNWVVMSLPKERDCQKIQALTRLQYAHRLAPDVFGKDYIKKSGENGTYRVVSMPSSADPMYQAAMNTYTLETDFYDNFNQYYQDIHDQLDASYFQWRMNNKEAVLGYNRFRKKIGDQNTKAIFGTLLSVGAAIALDGEVSDGEIAGSVFVLLQSLKTDDYGNFLFDPSAMIPEFAEVVANSREYGAMANEYARQADEISQALVLNTAPMIIEAKGRTYVLEGKIEDKFSHMQELMKDYYAEEAGFGEDDDANSTN